MKLAIVSTHPIQYHAPWFRALTSLRDFDLKVFYLWNFGITHQFDRGFCREIKWDVPLLSGYEYEFVHNKSRRPGTHHFFGLNNPELPTRVDQFSPDSVMFLGYKYLSHFRLLRSVNQSRVPVLFRGESNRFVSN